MISALAAAIWPLAGSALAWLLKYPTQGLIAIVDCFLQLPGNAYAVGTIPVITVIALYGLLGLTWLQPWWKRYWWIAFLLAIGLVMVPAWQARAALFRVTVMATPNQPVMVIQDAGRTTLINSGDAATTNFTLLPFMQKEGVNQLDWAISTETQTNPNSGWNTLLKRLPATIAYTAAEFNLPNGSVNQGQASSQSVLVNHSIKQTLPLSPNQPAYLGPNQVTLISKQPTIAEFRLHDQTWLWLGTLLPDQQKSLLATGTLHPVKVLWWSGKALHPDVIAALQPEVAIASANSIHSATEALLRDRGTRIYQTGKDGAIQWTATEGFKTTLERNEIPAL